MDYRYQHNHELTSYSRNNRKYQTDAEKKLWFHLRRKQMYGLKFHRQYPIGRYILDFYCLQKKFAIEVDGKHHFLQKKYDKRRSEYLNKFGIEVVRFWDNEVLKELDSVLAVIYKRLQA